MKTGKVDKNHIDSTKRVTANFLEVFEGKRNLKRVKEYKHSDSPLASERAENFQIVLGKNDFHTGSWFDFGQGGLTLARGISPFSTLLF